MKDPEILGETNKKKGDSKAEEEKIQDKPRIFDEAKK